MLGYNPKFDFNDGIEETIKWSKEMMIGNNKND